MNPFAPIEATLEQRQQQSRPLDFFLRNDDVDDDETLLRNLLQVCSRHNMPINLAVIPGRLTEAGALWLNECVQQYPELIELSQHGWMHVNHEREGRKCEFGQSRNLEEQLADITAGQKRMNEAFGQHWLPAFVPPWNRCTMTTATALDQLGFRALSRIAGQMPFSNCQFSEFPVTVDIYRWRGGAALRSTEELAPELAQQIISQDRIGLMLHHKVMDAQAFAFLNKLLELLNRFSIVHPQTLQKLLN
ncbi:MAG TPA: hypothetical protein PLK30_07805 [Blastocatellia bacterium]|nr:hypothetical protein [Blastocatellia bacterium]